MKRPRSYNTKASRDLPYITDPIVYEILTWVPAHDLVRYKIVCKQWKSWIDEPAFIDLHKSRARQSILATALFACNGEYSDNIHSLPHSFGGEDIFVWNKRRGRILGSTSCGLVCIETCKSEYRVRNNYYVLNPATGKSLRLPRLKNNSYAVEMRVYPDPQISGQFSVVAYCKFSSKTPNRTFYWAFYTLGVSSKWRCVDFNVGLYPYAVTLCTVILCKYGPICLVKYGRHKLVSMLQQDPHSREQSSVDNTPFYLDSERNILRSAHEWDGCFSISTIGERYIESWIRSECNYWINVERYITPEQKQLVFNRPVSVCLVSGGKMWLKSKDNTDHLFSIDLTTNKVERVVCNGEHVYDFNTYFSTLESLKGMK